MRRTASVIVVLVCGGLAAPAPSTATACERPRGVVVGQAAAGVLRVSWRPPSGPARIVPVRVLRGATVVGQTTQRSMRVRARPGALVSIRAGFVRRGGRAPACYATRRVRVARPVRPAAPATVTVESASGSSIVLRWSSVTGATGYRVVRDGRVVGQGAATHRTIPVRPGAEHVFTVRAMAGDRLGRVSRAVRFSGELRPPSAVGNLTAPVATTTRVRLSWEPAQAGSAPLGGYRIARDGRVLAQVPGTAFEVAGLTPRRQYRLTVAAVDRRGVAGPRTDLLVETRPPEPSRGRVQAYVLASTDESFASLRRDHSSVGTVLPTFYDCVHSAPGTIAGRHDPLLVQWAKDRQMRVVPRFNCQRPATLRAIFTQPAIRSSLLTQLVDLAVTHDYDGINLDFEAGAPQDRDSLTAFVADLAAGLHAAGRRLILNVSPKTRDIPEHPRSGFFDYVALSRHADELWVMSWGLHWATSRPGPLSPLPWLRQVYDYVAGLGRPGQYVMGLNFYAFDWANGGGPANPARALSFGALRQLLEATGATPQYDEASGEYHFTYVAEGVVHEVWFGDGPSIAQKFVVGRERGLGGVGVWRTGQEDPTFWSSLERLGLDR